MKYMGSKNRIAKYIVPILEESFIKNNCVDFIDACVGGANLIDKIKFTENLFGYDINEYVIAMWEELQKGWIPELINKEQYKDIRTNKDKYPKHIVGWVGIGCSYCGKWFGGFAGETKTKDGVRDYQEEALKNLKEQVKLLDNVKFSHSSLFDLIPKNKSLIYCDIPYKDTTKYKDEFDHEIFYKWCKSMEEKGHIVFISEYSMPNDFECVWSKAIGSSLSANGQTGKSKNSVEKLFKIK